MYMKEKIGRLMAMVCLCALFCTGCGETKKPESVNGQTIYISKEGEITLWLVTDFDGADYNISELTSMAVKEVSQFNADRAPEAFVTVEKVEALPDDSGRAAVTYQFGNWQSCTDFIGNELFYGTNQMFYGMVSEALSMGYGSEAILKNVKDNTLYTEEQLKQVSGQYLIVTDVKADIYCPGRVAYISDGASLNEDGSVNTFEVEGLAYILLK